MQPAVRYWTDREGMEPAIREALSAEATRSLHLEGTAHPELVDPDSWILDQHWLDRAGRDQVTLDLLYDYQSNIS